MLLVVRVLGCFVLVASAARGVATQRVEPSKAPELAVTVDGERCGGRFVAISSVSTYDDRFWLCFAPDSEFEFAASSVRLVGLGRELTPDGGSHALAGELPGRAHWAFELDAGEARTAAELSHLPLGLHTGRAVELEAAIELTAQHFEVGWPVSATFTIRNRGREAAALAFRPIEGSRMEPLSLELVPAVPKAAPPDGVPARATRSETLSLPAGASRTHFLSLDKRLRLDVVGEYVVTVGVDYELLGPRSPCDAAQFCPVAIERELVRLRASAPLSLAPRTTPLPPTIDPDAIHLTSVALDDSLFLLCAPSSRLKESEVAAALTAAGLDAERIKSAPKRSNHKEILLEPEVAHAIAGTLGITPALRPPSRRKLAATLVVGEGLDRASNELPLRLALRNVGDESIPLRWWRYSGLHLHDVTIEPEPPKRPPTGPMSWSAQGSVSSHELAVGEEFEIRLSTLHGYDFSKAGRYDVTLRFEWIAPEDAIPERAGCRLAAERLLVIAKGRLVLE
ncbi:MAG: LytR C-terminal domain-containing protein [Planctomycetes bacterium]|nr:LytR C-terminal domain-containing protein [Planctomycetota bacterium]